MPLTPADVHNVAFSKPPIGKRGYNEDEVDQFLDLVEDTLAELQDENADLKQKLQGASAQGSSAVASQPQVDEAELRRKIEAELRPQIEADAQRKAQSQAQASTSQTESAAQVEAPVK